MIDIGRLMNESRLVNHHRDNTVDQSITYVSINREYNKVRALSAFRNYIQLVGVGE